MLPAATDARRELIESLQLAYSGELGAIRAYLGHARTLRGRPERALVSRILKDEIRHRRRIGEMLAELGSAPEPRRERKMNRVGRTISCLCHLGGWFLPMYGAARLELDNIVEYEIAARLALLAGCEQYVDELLTLGEVEWDHELWLREQASTHWGWKVMPTWQPPPPRASIRERFEAFVKNPEPIVCKRSRLTR